MIKEEGNASVPFHYFLSGANISRVAVTAKIMLARRGYFNFNNIRFI